jgi:hypothetical protein
MLEIRIDDNDLIYTAPVPHAPLKLYIYGPDGYHSGGVWFRPVPKYPDEEISTDMAKILVTNAIANHQEVRICDGGDFLVFHAKGGEILFPESGDEFWKQVMQEK